MSSSGRWPVSFEMAWLRVLCQAAPELVPILLVSSRIGAEIVAGKLVAGEVYSVSFWPIPWVNWEKDLDKGLGLLEKTGYVEVIGLRQFRVLETTP